MSIPRTGQAFGWLEAFSKQNKMVDVKGREFQSMMNKECHSLPKNKIDFSFFNNIRLHQTSYSFQGANWNIWRFSGVSKRLEL